MEIKKKYSFEEWLLYKKGEKKTSWIIPTIIQKLIEKLFCRNITGEVNELKMFIKSLFTEKVTQLLFKDKKIYEVSPKQKFTLSVWRVVL